MPVTPYKSQAEPAREDKARWFEQYWFLFLCLILCFPVGLVLLWTSRRAEAEVKLVATLVVIFLMVVPAGLASVGIWWYHYHGGKKDIGRLITHLRRPKLEPLPEAKELPPDEFREGVIYLIPLGTSVDTEFIKEVIPYLEERFHYRCEVGETLPTPLYAYNEQRGQYDASLILDKLEDLKGQLPENAVKVLGVAEVDLYTSSSRHCFAKFHYPGKFSVMSLSRFKEESHGRYPNKHFLLRRAVIQASTCLAFNLGLESCDHPTCLMANPNSLLELDRKDYLPCSLCQEKLEIFLNIEDHLRKGEGEKALIEAKKLEKAAPIDAKLYSNLGIISRQHNFLDGSVYAYKKAVAIDPRARTYCELASVYEKMEMFDKAIEAANRAIELNPDYRWAYEKLGYSYRKKGMNDEAISALKRAIELYDSDSWDHGELASVYVKLEMFDKAIEAANRAIELDPDYRWAYRKLGYSYHKKGMQDEAISALKRAIELYDSDRWSHNTLGIIYRKKKMYDESILHYQKALEIEPKSGTYNGLGCTYMDLDNYEQAAICFKKEIEFDNDRTKYTAYAKNNLGFLSDHIREDCFATGDYDKAVEEQEKVLKIYPDIPKAYVLLGDCYKKKGEMEKAIAEHGE